jgi:hypothetical protein
MKHPIEWVKIFSSYSFNKGSAFGLFESSKIFNTKYNPISKLIELKVVENIQEFYTIDACTFS